MGGGLGVGGAKDGQPNERSRSLASLGGAKLKVHQTARANRFENVTRRVSIDIQKEETGEGGIQYGISISSAIPRFGILFKDDRSEKTKLTVWLIKNHNYSNSIIPLKIAQLHQQN